MANKLRVLHLEDDKTWRDTVREVLEDAGYEVTSFGDLASAQTAANDSFDYYVCDRNLRRSDGHKDDAGPWTAELCAAGKKAMTLATESYQNVPFVSKMSEWHRTLPSFVQSL